MARLIRMAKQRARTFMTILRRRSMSGDRGEGLRLARECRPVDRRSPA